jgi:hypothetical protein
VVPRGERSIQAPERALVFDIEHFDAAAVAD